MGGMSSDYTSGYDWSSHRSVTGKSAKDYAQDDDRRYSGQSSRGLGAPQGKEISTESPLAAILVVDVTGSMHTWPKLIFEKIPTLYNEANVALQGLDIDELEKSKKEPENVLEMAVIAIGDARMGDRQPLQVLDFSKDADLVTGVNKIWPEGGGHGNLQESYDLALYFILKHCSTPKVPKKAKPLLIIAGDEGFYDDISKSEVKGVIGDTLKEDLKTADVIEKLVKAYDVFVLRPEPAGSYSASDYAGVHKQWQEVLGPQRVMRMEDPKRLVDCIIGICAYASDNFDVGKALLERRQTPEQVKQVLEALHPLLKEGGK